jgi:Uma2 family endonuclease
VAIITNIDQLDPQGSYTYADYLTWRFEEMVEIIKGKVFHMSPAPTQKHQRVSYNLALQVGNFLRKSQCQPFYAPADVVLYDGRKSALQKKEIHTVVQPDLFVVCDPQKLDGQVCNGSPDWIIEILSPATKKKDLTLKFNLYEENAVREYWIVFPQEETVQKFLLDETTLKYEFAGNYSEGKVPVGIFPELEVDLEEVFGN